MPFKCFEAFSGRRQRRDSPPKARPPLLQLSLPRRPFPLNGGLGGAVDGRLVGLLCYARALEASYLPLHLGDAATRFIEAPDLVLALLREVGKLACPAARESPARAPALLAGDISRGAGA